MNFRGNRQILAIKMFHLELDKYFVIVTYTDFVRNCDIYYHHPIQKDNSNMIIGCRHLHGISYNLTRLFSARSNQST
ncbi:MAG: hypothetical protein QOK88_02705 [Nitrososphaeraceae archaeon]|nr:hypothetical protein [Nitrososphaeraceae archaeon]